jgi:hypothetical protein
MTEFKLFQNSEMLPLVGALGVILWIFFLWKEWHKPLSKFFYMNGLIALLTIIAVAMLALKPQTISVFKEMGVLLTDGYEQQQLDSLKKLQKDLKIYSYQENLPMEEVLDSLGGMYILGDGVKRFDFWQYKNREVTYLDAEIPKGIIRLKYPSKNKIGEDLVLKGRYHRSKTKNRLVIQDGSGLGLDSVALHGNEFQDFELRLPLKTTGKYVFHLAEKDSLGELILSNPIPFQVSARDNLKILVLNGFPSFETKYLKNYLSEMGHEVVVRSQFSKERYKFEYLNTSRIPIYRLDKSVLKPFDLMIIDANSYRSLSRSARIAIQESIAKEGLGLFIQPDAYLSGFTKEEIGFRLIPDRTSKVVLDDFPERTLIKSAYVFENTLGLEEIHAANKKVITGYKRLAKGRIGTTLISNTYQLQLDGKTKVYEQFWSSIIEKLGKNYLSNTVWNFENPFPLQDEPLPFELHTNVEKPKVEMLQANRIALRQDRQLLKRWNGVVYPKVKGWNQIQLEGDSLQAASFYVTDSIYWKALRQYNLQEGNKLLFENNMYTIKPSPSYELIDPIWFFILGLTGLSYLWVYPKIFQN